MSKSRNDSDNLPQESANSSEQEYFVVKNIEEQYSIWPIFKEIPSGWESIGEPRIKSECLEFIKEVWTDMRPLSLRKEMEKAANQ